MLNSISGAGGQLPKREDPKKAKDDKKDEGGPDLTPQDQVTAIGNPRADLIRQNIMALEQIQSQLLAAGSDEEAKAKLKTKMAEIEVALENAAAANIAAAPEDLAAQIKESLKNPGTLKGPDVLRHIRP